MSTNDTVTSIVLQARELWVTSLHTKITNTFLTAEGTSGSTKVVGASALELLSVATYSYASLSPISRTRVKDGQYVAGKADWANRISPWGRGASGTECYNDERG
jgi:hypothetical protein